MVFFKSAVLHASSRGCETLVKCSIKLPEAAVGRILGPRGSNNKAIEGQLGTTFALLDVLDPAEVSLFVQVVLFGRGQGAEYKTD